MGVSSSEPSQHSPPCTDLLFLLALLPPPPPRPTLLSPTPMALPMVLPTLALLPLTPMLLMELLLPLLLLPLLLTSPPVPSLMPSLLLSLTALDSQRPLDMLFPQSDRSRRLPLLSNSSSPLNSGDTRLLTKQFS